ncbi:ATP-binding protein [Salimicrobium humidisoli]|uniref:IstB-like ATP-binding domain-containing protein n=1 Tax=Salimicrobium humidisoli TaxID=2029857 RepID=A0ABX4HQX1_9BACI|nr:hypothetical protein CKW00_08450 [Salimicrobium humidisoli]
MNAHTLFRIISRSYAHGAMIVISQKSYVGWGKIFGDKLLPQPSLIDSFTVLPL